MGNMLPKVPFESLSPYELALLQSKLYVPKTPPKKKQLIRGAIRAGDSISIGTWSTYDKDRDSLISFLDEQQYKVHNALRSSTSWYQEEDKVSVLPTKVYATRMKEHSKELKAAATLLKGAKGDDKFRYLLLKLIYKQLNYLSHYVNSKNIKAIINPIYDQTPSRSQKVNGLKFLSNLYNLPGVHSNPSFFVLPYQLPGHFPIGDGTFFARPAPSVPRHGFVDSKPVKTWKEIYDLYRKALEADPISEMILTEPLTGEYSGVATNAGVAWGIGNEGVTGEGNNVVFIPSAIPADKWNENFFKRQGYPNHEPSTYGINNAAYLELVVNRKKHTSLAHGQIIGVQLRDGPPQPATTNFITEDMVVQRYIRMGDIDGNGTSWASSLLRWEMYIKRMVADYPEGKGLMLVFPGGSLSSHYAVHAIAHGISVWVAPSEANPKQDPKDNIFKAEAASVKELADEDLQKIAAFAKDYHKEEKLITAAQGPNVAYTTVGVVHAMTQWGNDEHLLRLRAFGMEALLRFLTAASIGELRHWDNTGPGRMRVEMQTDVKKHGFKALYNDRAMVYREHLKPYEIQKRAAMMRTAVRDFKADNWRSGYGGRPWADVAKATHQFAVRYGQFLKRPNLRRWKKLTLAANVALHMAHNNGSALGKWIDTRSLDEIAMIPTMGFTNKVAAELALNYQKETA